MKDKLTPKEHLIEAFPELEENQIYKVLEAYFTLGWMNPSIDINVFIDLLNENWN